MCWDWRPVPDPALWDSKKKSVEKGEKPKVTGLVYGEEFKLEWEVSCLDTFARAYPVPCFVIGWP